MLHFSRRLLIMIAASSVLSLGAAGAVASAASAAPSGGGSCPVGPESQPFAHWGDQSSYELAPGGDFETPGWSLANGAAVVAGSEPFAATGTLGSSSLSLPAGASSTSPMVCLDASEPTLRFFVGGTGTVLVQMVDGNWTIPVGIASGNGSWEPSPVVMTGSKLLGMFGRGTTRVSIKFTALTGQPLVDDVFLDPWFRG
jgi:hypothetical protein